MLPQSAYIYLFMWSKQLFTSLRLLLIILFTLPKLVAFQEFNKSSNKIYSYTPYKPVPVAARSKA
jgi:hypothetical protein